MGLLEGIEGIVNFIIKVVDTITSALDSTVEALTDFYNTLCDMRVLIFNMVSNPSTGTGLPVVEAIGLVRYLVGDVIFHLIYIIILIGCLFTIYKLVCLLVDAWHEVKATASGGSMSGSAIANIISKLIK